jgi:hypothetical protein
MPPWRRRFDAQRRRPIPRLSDNALRARGSKLLHPACLWALSIRWMNAWRLRRRFGTGWSRRRSSFRLTDSERLMTAASRRSATTRRRRAIRHSQRSAGRVEGTLSRHVNSAARRQSDCGPHELCLVVSHEVDGLLGTDQEVDELSADQELDREGGSEACAVGSSGGRWSVRTAAQGSAKGASSVRNAEGTTSGWSPRAAPRKPLRCSSKPARSSTGLKARPWLERVAAAGQGHARVLA